MMNTMFNKRMFQRILKYIDIFPIKYRCEIVQLAYGWGDAICHNLVTIEHKDLTSKIIICDECKKHDIDPKYQYNSKTYNERLEWIYEYQKQKQKQMCNVINQSIIDIDIIKLLNIIKSYYTTIPFTVCSINDIDPFIKHFIPKSFDIKLYYRYYQLLLIKNICEIISERLNDYGRLYEALLSVYTNPNIYPLMLLDFKLHVEF
jgi:hypothetical protein